MRKRFREEEILGKPLTEQQKNEIARAQSAADADIDTTDIPEVRELPLGAVRGKYFQPFPGAVDIKAIRGRSGLSQAEFAKRYGFNVRTLQDWESSGAQPPSPVRAYLKVIDRFPEMVAKALQGAA
ncbi:MAG: helix-turn-helix domain-containing protein [Bryobacterales bacterium]|nr:helix-turn-helix domain-containing protein [Bryobacterales bacterium]